MTKKTGSKMAPPDMAAKGDELTGYGEEAAIGIDMRSSAARYGGLIRLRVTTALGVSFYDIDRFD